MENTNRTCYVCEDYIGDDCRNICYACGMVICNKCRKCRFDKKTKQYLYALDYEGCRCCNDTIRKNYDKILDKVSSEDKKYVERCLDELKIFLCAYYTDEF